MSVEDLDEAAKAEARLRALTKQALDKSVDDIDGATLRRLRQARQAALDQLPQRHSLLSTRSILVSAFSVTALALMLMLLNSHQSSDITALLANDDSLQQMDDFNLLANGEDLEFVNDLEFYEWLEQQDDKGGLG